jgi:hypothetical protein
MLPTPLERCAEVSQLVPKRWVVVDVRQAVATRRQSILYGHQSFPGERAVVLVGIPSSLCSCAEYYYFSFFL